MGIGDWAQSPIPNPQSPFLFLNISYLKIKIENDIFFLN